MDVNEQEQEEVREQPPKRYFIDTHWFDRTSRSFRAVAEKRFCASCQAKLGTEVHERVPVIDQKTGRVVYETRSVPFGSNPTAVIRGCCGKEKGYIRADMPVLEAIFRVFLLNGNQPIELEAVREELMQWFPLTSRAHGYSIELLQRLIEADDYYGLREFQPQALE